MHDAVANTLNALTTGDPELIGRVSTVSLKDANPNLQRKETITALKRRHTTYQKKRATMKKKGGSTRIPPPTIKEEDQEDNQGDDHIGLAREPNQNFSAPGQNIEQQEASGGSHQPVERTQTFLDPEGLDEREI